LRPSRKRLILFTRYPVPGRTKTRLIPALGPECAAELHRRLTEHVLGRAVSPAGAWEVEVRFQGGNRRKMASWLGEGFIYRPQGPGDLGRRMLRAFRGAFREGAEMAALVGSDLPGLGGRIVEKAFCLLRRADLVLGPALDGGYYLVGMKAPCPGLFEGIPWGTGRVLEETLARAGRLGLPVELLEPLADVDRPEDLGSLPPGLAPKRSG